MVLLSIECLFFVEDESPLIFAFEMLLDTKSGFKAVRSNAENLQALVNEVCELRSQVIILEDLAIKSEDNAIAELLASNSDLRIIIVLRDSNYIYTFKKEEVMIKSSSDFLDAIRTTSQVPDMDYQQE